MRADVKALNRRIEALLSEVDPVAISGNQITLAVPYPFHRDKLNSDDVRETVGGVLSRLLGKDISLVCILRSEMAAAPVQSSSDPGSGAVCKPTGRWTGRRRGRTGPSPHPRRHEHLRCGRDSRAGSHESSRSLRPTSRSRLGPQSGSHRLASSTAAGAAQSAAIDPSRLT